MLPIRLFRRKIESPGYYTNANQPRPDTVALSEKRSNEPYDSQMMIK